MDGQANTRQKSRIVGGVEIPTWTSPETVREVSNVIYDYEAEFSGYDLTECAIEVIRITMGIQVPLPAN